MSGNGRSKGAKGDSGVSKAINQGDMANGPPFCVAPRSSQAGGTQELSETGGGQHRYYKATYVNLSWAS